MQGGSRVANELRVHSKGLDLGVTDHTVDALSETWRFTLTWIGLHPFLFVIALGFLVWFVVSGRRTRMILKEMQLEYEARRRDIRDGGAPSNRPAKPRGAKGSKK